MSDSYEVLIDHEAAPEDAAAIGKSIIDALIDERIILPDANEDCVSVGEGHPPGPRLQEIYASGDPIVCYGHSVPIGVKLHTERYVNFFGFPVFEHSACPSCGERFSANKDIMDAIYDCVGGFINDGRLDDIVCPSCCARVRCDRWGIVPDVGFCHVAVEFWNWPCLTGEEWKLSIPGLIYERTGRRLTRSWGHV